MQPTFASPQHSVAVIPNSIFSTFATVIGKGPSYLKNMSAGSNTQQLANLLLETIRVDGGKLENIRYHNQRFNNARRELFGATDSLDLEEEITVPEHLTPGLFKCRVTYGPGILNVDFEPYRQRKITSLRLVHADDLDYSYKYADRSRIDGLFRARGGAGDILIVRNGLLTDTSYANVALWNGSHWITPEKPLLRGTCRERLLDEGRVVEGGIPLDSLAGFSDIWIFNAMMQLRLSLGPGIIMH